MKQRSVLFFAASWLVVRLRVALLSTRGLVTRVWEKSGVILVAPREEPLASGSWHWQGERLHHLNMARGNMKMRVLSFSELESN